MSSWHFETLVQQIASNDQKHVEVSCAGRNITDAHVDQICDALATNTHLRVLDLQNNDVTNTGAARIAEALKSTTTLREVNLENNHVGEDGVRVILSVLRENDSLTSCRVDASLPPALTAALTFALQLNSQPLPIKRMLRAFDDGNEAGAAALHLNGCDTSNLSMQFLTECILRNKFLREVDVSSTGLGDKGAETIGAILRRVPTIQSITMDGNGVGVHGIRDLCEGIKESTSLQFLSLRNNKIGDDSARVIIEALKTNDTLIKCHLEDNAVSQTMLQQLDRVLLLNEQPMPLKRALHNVVNNDATMTEVDLHDVPSMGLSANFLAPAMKTNTVVRVLNLCNARIGDEGAHDIASFLKQNNTLTTLHLANNKITMNGGNALATAMTGNHSLVDVNVANNEIRNEGALLFVKMLQVNVNIIALNIELNDVSEQVLQQIEWLLFVNLQPKALKRILPSIQNSDTKVQSVDFSQYDGEKYHGDGSMLVLCRYLIHNIAVTELNLENNNVGDMGAVHISDVLKESKQLTKVNLSNNGVCDRGAIAIAEALRVNTSLTYLNLENNCIADEGGCEFVLTMKENHGLSDLRLNGNRITQSIMSDLTVACAMNRQPLELKLLIPRLREHDPELRELDFSSGVKLFDDMSVTILMHELTGTDSVATLRLNNNAFEADGAAAIAEFLKSDTKLTVLDLANNTIGDVGAQAIADALKVNTTLRVLGVDNNHIGDRGAEALIDALRSNDTLVDLKFDRNDIALPVHEQLEDEIALNVQPLVLKRLLPRIMANDESLTVLDLTNGSNDADRKYDDLSCRSVAIALRRNTSVRALNLSDNVITSKGVMCLADMLEDNTTLVELSLARNNISNDGIQTLTNVLTASNHTVRLVDVTGNDGLTEDVLSELQYAVLFNNQPLALKQAVERLARNDPELRVLDFSNFDGRHTMNDVSMRLLCAMLLNNTSVEEINIQNNSFTDVGLALLSDVLRTNNTILALDVRNNLGITDAGINHLAQALKCNHALYNLQLDRKHFNADVLEEIDGAVVINAVPMSTQQAYKRPASSAVQNKHALMGIASYNPRVISPTAEKEENGLLLDDALRVWKESKN
eukprot:PhM_4_TR9944/c0_g1_i1/m.51531